jgi:hypothetical protein
MGRRLLSRRGGHTVVRAGACIEVRLSGVADHRDHFRDLLEGYRLGCATAWTSQWP